MYVWANISTNIVWYNNPYHDTSGKRSQVMWPCLSKMDVHFERFVKILKGYIRNWTRPEGYIIECYIVEKAIEFCSEYLLGVTIIGLPRDIIRFKCPS